MLEKPTQPKENFTARSPVKPGRTAGYFLCVKIGSGRKEILHKLESLPVHPSPARCFTAFLHVEQTTVAHRNVFLRANAQTIVFAASAKENTFDGHTHVRSYCVCV